MFQGSIVALITPFRQGQLDEAALARLVEWHIEQGTHGIVPVGTTGESPTLTHDEHCRVVELVVKQVAGRIPVIAGAGSNNPVEAIEYTRFAEQMGAAAPLAAGPGTVAQAVALFGRHGVAEEGKIQPASGAGASASGR